MPEETHPDTVERLTRVETKLDMVLVGLNDITKDHETRLRAVESQVASNTAIGRWKASTGLALFLACVGIVPWVADLVH